MQILFTILRKEFRQIFRNPTILRMILIMPIMQLILIPLAADYEVKFINLNVIDQDHSTYSQRLIQKMTASNYFRLVNVLPDFKSSLDGVNKGEVDVILTIPAGFEKNLIKESKNTLHLAADAVNGQKAGLGVAYAGQIIGNFNQEVRGELMQLPRHSEVPQIEILTQNWYNPHINYRLFMVPGILALLVTMVGALMSALNIVAEKEKGTIEQINVTPIKKYQFILGKLIPFWVIGLVSMTIGFVVSYVMFGILPVGSFATIYLFAAVYLLSVLGIGLLLSTFVDTQQQATLFAFFVMMLFVLMGGLYTPIESMPVWAQWMAWFIPTSHFIEIIRAIVLKGSTLGDLQQKMFLIIAFALVFNGLAIWNYRKRAA